MNTIFRFFRAACAALYLGALLFRSPALWEAARWLYLTGLSAEDLLDNKISNRALAFGLFAELPCFFLSGAIPQAEAAAFLPGLLALLLSAFRPGAIGMGDVKLLFLLGLLLGKSGLFGAIFGAGAIACVLACSGRSREKRLPLAPLFSAGYALHLLFRLAFPA